MWENVKKLPIAETLYYENVWVKRGRAPHILKQQGE
jgi:hypothetical protein